MYKKCLIIFLLITNLLADENKTLPKIGVYEKLGEYVPLDLVLTDQTGKSATLKEFMNDKPTVISFNYYTCPGICSPQLAGMAKVIDKPNSTCFKNIIYPKYKASVYCTYIALDSNLFSYTEYSRKLAYEHTIKANGIEEVVYSDTAKNVFGTSFNIRGNVACNYLFYLTDSSSNYFAGSLYFENVPNYDSLQPVLEYIVEDVEHLINTFEWK